MRAIPVYVFLWMICLLVVVGLLLLVRGCSRQTGGSHEGTTGNGASQVEGAGEQHPNHSGNSGELQNQGESSSSGSSLDPSGAQTDGDTSHPGTGRPASEGATGVPPASPDLAGGSGANTHDEFSSAGRNLNLPGRNAAVEHAREALANAQNSSSAKSYKELVEAWEGLQSFMENDREVAELAGKLLKEMDRLGTLLDQSTVPYGDKPFIAH